MALGVARARGPSPTRPTAPATPSGPATCGNSSVVRIALSMTSNIRTNHEIGSGGHRGRGGSPAGAGPRRGPRRPGTAMARLNGWPAPTPRWTPPLTRPAAEIGRPVGRPGGVVGVERDTDPAARRAGAQGQADAADGRGDRFRARMAKIGRAHV